MVSAGALGIGLSSAAFVGAFLALGLVSCDADGFGCIDYVLLIVIGAPLVAAIAAWPLLYALRIRPALRVAVGGSLATVAIGCLLSRASSANGYLIVNGLFVGPALGYGIAAFVTAGTVRRRWRVPVAVAVVVVAVIALVPLAGVG